MKHMKPCSQQAGHTVAAEQTMLQETCTISYSTTANMYIAL
jgi:hypothetical protein